MRLPLVPVLSLYTSNPYSCPSEVAGGSERLRPLSTSLCINLLRTLLHIYRGLLLLVYTCRRRTNPILRIFSQSTSHGSLFFSPVEVGAPSSHFQSSPSSLVARGLLVSSVRKSFPSSLDLKTRPTILCPGGDFSEVVTFILL